MNKLNNGEPNYYQQQKFNMGEITNIEIYLENQCWYVKYIQNGETIISNPFMEEQHAINYCVKYLHQTNIDT